MKEAQPTPEVFFLRRFVERVLPRGFPRIRYFRLLASAAAVCSSICRTLLAVGGLTLPLSYAVRATALIQPENGQRALSVGKYTVPKTPDWSGDLCSGVFWQFEK